MRARRTAAAAVFIVSIFLLSCEAPFNFEEPEEKGVSMEVETVASGTFLRPGDTVPVSLYLLEGGVTPARMDFRLSSGDGESRASSSIDLEGADYDSLPALEIPELDPGFYTFEVTVYDFEESLLYVESSRIFIVSGTYTIRRISTLPVSVEPESDVLLLAMVDVPEGTKPHLVWRMGDEIIHEGTVTSGTFKAHWRAPEVVGVYSLRAELFPFRPDRFDGFHSEAALETEVYVSRSVTGSKSDLGPGERYANLFHFHGNYSDKGYAGENRRVEEVGNPLFDVRDNLYGLSLGRGSGLVFSGIEPLSFGEEPFSLVIRMLADGEPEESSLLRFLNESGGTVFTLTTDGEGELKGGYAESGLTADIPSGIVPAEFGEPFTLVLSVYPAEGGIEWYWYVNGRFTVMQRTAALPDGTVSSLELGGENGMVALIDELGIHTRNDKGQPSALEEPFATAVLKRYGSAVRYAEGFDGGGMPSDMTVQGAVEFVRGRVLITPEASILLPSLDVEGEKISLGLYLPEVTGNIRIEYSLGGAEPVTREVIVGGEGVTPDTDGYVWIELTPGPEEAGGLSMRLENGSGDAPLIVGAIILLTEGAEITEKTEPEEVSVIS